MQVIILGSGSKGNSTLLITNTKKILIDVGFSYTKTKNVLAKYNISFKEIDFILITHSHKDHIAGLTSLVKKEQKKVYIPIGMLNEIKQLIPKEFIITIKDENFIVEDLKIRFIPTSHDTPVSVGFVIEDTSSLVYITDTGYISQKNLEYMYNKNLYIIESNHDPKMLMEGPYPYILKQRVISDIGHLSNEMTGNYLKKLIGSNTKKIVLAHLSEINNTEELALETVIKIIETNIEIKAAKQNEELSVLI